VDASAELATGLLTVCAIAAALGLAAWLRPARPAIARAADGAGMVGLALALAAWIVRWRAAGHLPLFGTYESSLSLAAAVLLGALVARLRVRVAAGVWPPACVVAGLIVAHALPYDRTIYPLTISERSWVVEIHAWIAWAAFAALSINAALALMRIVRGEWAHFSNRWLSFSLSLGFALHTAMMATGSFYKFLLFGQAWNFDPIETLGFVAWVAYGTLLHMHLFAAWEGARLARWCLAVFVLLVVSYRGIVYFPSWSTYHIFDMDLRTHITGSETPSEGGPP
jgi:ABC-type uncharacterized transport system permease subunit